MSKPDPDPKPPSGSSTEKDPVADHVTEELSDDLRNVGLSDEATEELSVPINVSEGDGETDQKAEDEEEEEGRERVEKRMMVYPVRPDAEDCSFYIRTGSCKYGSSCKFNHPVRRKLQIGREKVKEKEREENVENPRLMECKYYFRTGGCKYGETCRFSHTKEHTPLPSRPELNFLGLPIRPGEKECPFYMRNGSCKFGGDCKFNHPDPTAVGGVDSPLFRGNNGGSFAPKDAPQASSTSWSSPRHMNGTGTAPFIPVMYSQNRGVSPQTPEWSGYQAPSAYPPERNILPPSTYSANNSLAETSSFSQLQSTEEFPERPDQPECSYYVKTGDCKFKYKCKYHHPKNRLPKQSPSSFNDKGLPLRPEQSMCTHYSRYGICKFGQKDCVSKTAMAGRSGSQVMTMTVTNTPSADLAFTNLAYCSSSDLRQFSVPGSDLFLANVADTFILSLCGHGSIRDGSLALNAIQRRHARVSTGDIVSVSRFVPPENFELAMLTLELEFVKKGTKSEQVDAALLSTQLKRKYTNQVLTVGQKATFEYHGTNYILTVNRADVEGQNQSNGIERGMLSPDTYIVFEASNASGIKIVNQREAASSNIFKHKEFNLESLGIGGLGAEFADIFRRAFASRVFPPHVTSRLGIKHVKGMLLFGPPGTGKTLMARQIGKMLNGKDPKIVNGPEVLSKFVGETEKNVRDLFADAEQDQRTLGDASELHVIIFDEIDAICKSRGSTRDGTGVHDSIVNQLLTKIDGVEALNNVLLIGMTNRKDLLDEALLRPGRLEVQVEISLPDEAGRFQILQIHTNKMKENSFLGHDINLQELAARTKNYSGAELEGVVKSATSYALNRQLSMDDLTKPVEEENIKITMEDFLHAIHEVQPAFGASTDDLERCRLNGMVDSGDRHNHIYKRAMLLVEQVKVSTRSPLVTCLLEGPSGSGKTALAATVGIDSDFPYVKIVSAETMIGLQESTKCAHIVKVFEDAYKSPMSIIILDDIERLLEYVAIGPRFSNIISQTLMVLLKRLPPKGKKLLVFGTTSQLTFLDSVGICEAFSITYSVPTLRTEDAKKVLKQLNVFSEDDIDAAAEALDDMPIKKLYMLIEMAAQGEDGGSAEAIYAGREKIKITHFFDCLQDVVRF